MKIIYFSKDYAPHDHRFLSALAETEHEIYYLRLERGLRQTEDRPVPSRVEQLLWKGGQRQTRLSDGFQLLMDLRRVIKKVKPDIIHAGPIQTCGLLAALSGFHPLLIMSWGFDLMQDADRGPRWRWATRYVLGRADYFTSDAEVTRQKAISFGMARDRTVVFPWGVDLGHFSPSSVVDQQSSAFTLFCNRSWEPRYGVDVLARAFVRVAQQREDVGLMLLSGGSQAAIIRQILERGGVVDRVTFAGQISHKDLPRYYRMADLYISPSHIDGSSVSLMEALACGLPCLVSNIPAHQEWLTDGVNGWTFPDGNVDALASKILAAVEDHASLEKFRRAARATAEEKADWKKNFGKLLEAYEKVTNG
jgi:glycosyltransferase involved in cell wall biosynthesis